VQVRHDEGVAIRIDPEPCAVVRKVGQRSVGRGTHRPAIEPRKDSYPGRRRCCEGGRQHGRTRQRERLDSPAWSTWHVQKLLVREPGDPTRANKAALVRIGEARSPSR
jgi:hypothetical protein